MSCLQYLLRMFVNDWTKGKASFQQILFLSYECDEGTKGKL